MSRGRHPYGPAYEFSAFVERTCRPGAGAATCRFLVGDIAGGAVTCAKLEPVLTEQIALRHALHSMVARGDNCPGRPYGEEL